MSTEFWMATVSLAERLVIPFATVFISLLLYFHYKNQIVIETITKYRLSFQQDFRTHLVEFLELYYLEQHLLPAERHKLICKKYQIDLYSNPKYENDRSLNIILLKYLEAPVNDIIQDHSELMKIAQKILIEAYARAKNQAGITKRINKRHARQV